MHFKSITQDIRKFSILPDSRPILARFSPDSRPISIVMKLEKFCGGWNFVELEFESSDLVSPFRVRGPFQCPLLGLKEDTSSRKPF